MINRLKPKSEFTRHVLTLMTGTTIAQAIPIAISPILTRLYTPEQFGTFSIFIAITSILGSVVTGRYELAIMLPEEEEDAINIFALSIIITTTISLFLLIIVLLFKETFLLYLGSSNLNKWIYLVPFSVFFMGLYNTLNYYNIRNKKYKDLAKAVIIKTVTIAILQLSIGLLKSGVIGLITGQFVSQLFANTVLFKNIISNKNLLSKISTVKIFGMAHKYKNFPKFSMWAGLSNTLSTHLTNILISSFFGISILGFYAFVQRILGTPSALIGNSISHVFFQSAILEKQNTGEITTTFKSTLTKLIIVGVPTFTLLFFVVENLFALIFSESWRIAGEYAQILTILFAVRFISSPLSVTMTIFEKQKQALIINIILLLSSIITVFVSTQIGLSFKEFLMIYSLLISLEYLVFLLYYFKLAKG